MIRISVLVYFILFSIVHYITLRGHNCTISPFIPGFQTVDNEPQGISGTHKVGELGMHSSIHPEFAVYSGLFW